MSMWIQQPHTGQARDEPLISHHTDITTGPSASQRPLVELYSVDFSTHTAPNTRSLHMCTKTTSQHIWSRTLTHIIPTPPPLPLETHRPSHILPQVVILLFSSLTLCCTCQRRKRASHPFLIPAIVRHISPQVSNHLIYSMRNPPCYRTCIPPTTLDGKHDSPFISVTEIPNSIDLVQRSHGGTCTGSGMSGYREDVRLTCCLDLRLAFLLG